MLDPIQHQALSFDEHLPWLLLWDLVSD